MDAQVFERKSKINTKILFRFHSTQLIFNTSNVPIL